MSNLIISRCDAGIGNRIKVIMSSLRLSGDTEVVWTKDFVFPYESLHEYFPELKEATNTAGKRINNNWRLATVAGDTPDNFSTANEQWKNITGTPLTPASPQNNSIDFEYNRIPEKVKREYVSILNSIKVSNNILHEVDTFYKNLDENTVGVHIRTWKDSPQRAAMFYSLDKYVELMSKHPDKKFFVATDNKAIVDQLSKKFPGKIITREDNNKRMDAFVEMLLLSKCSNIIGSPFSTFTELAWWYSSCKSNVEIAWK